MANIQIVKYKIRRGSDTQRKLVILDQGELGYTIDTKRLFIGTGTLSGGHVIGSKIHNPVTNIQSLTTINAEVGDLVSVKNTFYQLTASSWNSITSWKNSAQSIDPNTFEYDSSVLKLKDNSISAKNLDSNTIGDGLKIDSGFLKTDINTNSLEISSGKLSIKNSGIGARELDSAAFGDAITGGSGSSVKLNYDSNIFYIKTGNKLSLSAFPSSSITFNTIDSNWIGDGLIYDAPNKKIKSKVTGIIGNPLTQDLSGRIGFQGGFTGATNELSQIESDEYGRVVSNESSIYDSVSCLSATNSGALSALFNGTPNQVLSGSIPNLPLTVFSVLSANVGGTVSMELSSAGFLMFEGESVARQDGKYIGRFAIPIFIY